MWGSNTKQLNYNGPCDSVEYVDQFFSETHENSAWKLSEVEKQLQEFVQKQIRAKRRGIALVSSGATTVPLDEDSDTFVDLSSRVQAYQGPACVEYLLHLGYAVIFVHRLDSQQPFTRHFQKYIKNGGFMKMLHTSNDQLILDVDHAQRNRFQNILSAYENSTDRLFSISFTSVQKYLYLLRLTTQIMAPLNTRAIVILAATVMEFYVPLPTTDTNKSISISKRKSNFFVQFIKVPNLIRKIRKNWCPKAMIVTFKSQLQETELIEEAHADLEKWGVDVVATTNRSYPHRILLVSEQEDKIVSCPEDEDINDAFAASIAETHRQFQKKRKILQKGKQLLLLSAKFCMLKEKDLLNEDAEGNKNVKFGKGVKICADRRWEGQDKPIYELKHIFQNKTKCARAHIWEGSVQLKSGDSQQDVVVAFSPAGTPDTIRDAWGDFWSGWAEDELIEFKKQMKTMTFTSALDVVLGSIAGDYSSATSILQYMWSKIGSAWSDGEQTRIRQSIQNIIAVGLNRGLVDVEDISSSDDLLLQPRVRRFDSLVLEQEKITTGMPVYGNRLRHGSSDEEMEAQPVYGSNSKSVRVHRAVKAYMDDMIDQGLVDEVMKYIEKGVPVRVTGYSMGGMLGQLLMLYIGDQARMKGLDTSKINFVGFGSSRVGDEGFAARLKLLFKPEQMLIIMHPSDTVHAFPPRAEGYADAAIKIFLREDGLGVGRRTASKFSLLPATRSLDRIFEGAFASRLPGDNRLCSFCSSKTHSSEQHRCRYCIERGSHRGSDCPNRNKPCRLCGKANHCTGEHRCNVCQQFGHRGRECHVQGDVGLAELVTYFRFHHFLYYNSSLKTSVEFSAA